MQNKRRMDVIENNILLAYAVGIVIDGLLENPMQI